MQFGDTTTHTGPVEHRSMTRAGADSSTARAHVREADDGGVDVVLSGELDHDGVERVGAVVLRVAGDAAVRVGLDTSDVSFVDSAGLRLLLRAHQAATGRGVPCAIDRPSAQMERLLTLTGLEELIGAR